MIVFKVLILVLQIITGIIIMTPLAENLLQNLFFFQSFFFQRRGSLVFLYVFGPYVIEKVLAKLELWLQSPESQLFGMKCFLY